MKYIEGTRIRDLSIETFGHLHPKEFLYTKNGNTYWRCECDCPAHTEVITYTDLLTSGHKTSCGCASAGKGKFRGEDISGNRYGKVVVLGYNGEKRKWHYRCECGNESYATKYDLIHKIRSCGKCNVVAPNFNDLTDTIWGNWYVIEKAEKRYGQTYWKCECLNCHTVRDVYSGSLIHNKSVSCGCLDLAHNGSDAENEILEYINDKFSNLDIIKHNKSILNGKEIDIYIPSLKIGIEYNGSGYHATENAIYKNLDKYYHRDKFLLAKSKGVHLITIFDIDYEFDKQSILDLLFNIIINPKNKFILPTKDIEYTNNDYDLGEYMKDFGYEEIGQEEPTSFIYNNRFVVYRCGRTIWKKL